MEIKLYVNSSEVNKINKSLSDEISLTGNLRNESNVITPSILIYNENPTKYNYCYIPEFKRYYFIKDMASIRTNVWRLNLESDPLMSFKNAILKCNVILNETTITGANKYLDGRNWIANCKSKTDIISFSGGLLDQGEYILITAGG